MIGYECFVSVVIWYSKYILIRRHICILSNENPVLTTDYGRYEVNSLVLLSIPKMIFNSRQQEAEVKFLLKSDVAQYNVTKSCL